jgi:hypothetical protein
LKYDETFAMVLRPRKSLHKLSAWFSEQAQAIAKSRDQISICLVWILLQPTEHKQWESGSYKSCVDKLTASISSEQRILSVAKLTNTHPKALTPFGVSLDISPESSPDTLLVHVGADGLQTVLTCMRALLNDEDLTTGTAGSKVLNFKISVYTRTQVFSPRSSHNIIGSCKVIVAINPSEGQEEDIDAWYRKEQLPLRAQTSPELFLRCTRYTKIMDPSTEGEVDDGIAAPLLAVHEYVSKRDLIRHSVEKGRVVPETDWTRKVYAEAKEVRRTIWEVG